MLIFPWLISSCGGNSTFFLGRFVFVSVVCPMSILYPSAVTLKVLSYHGISSPLRFSFSTVSLFCIHRISLLSFIRWQDFVATFAWCRNFVIIFFRFSVPLANYMIFHFQLSYLYFVFVDEVWRRSVHFPFDEGLQSCYVMICYNTHFSFLDQWMMTSFATKRCHDVWTLYQSASFGVYPP